MSEDSVNSPIHGPVDSSIPNHGPVRLAVPKVGCLPVCPLLITFSILGMYGAFWLFFASLASSARADTTYLQSILGFTFHCLVLIGTISSNDTILYVCQGLTVMSMVISVFLFFLIIAVFNTTSYTLVLEMMVVASAAVTYLEYACIKRLIQHIAEKRGTDGNQSLA